MRIEPAKIERTFTPEERMAHNEAIMKIIRHLSANPSYQTSLTKSDAMTFFTGKGSLHGLNFSDYANYQEFKVAKQQTEQGQFFTPHDLIEDIIAHLPISEKDLICDPTCGHGNWFNHAPVPETHCYGVEHDIESWMVAKFLYSDAHIHHHDIRSFSPKNPHNYIPKVDWILGNPPFGISFPDRMRGYVSSEHYTVIKSAEMMKPGAFLVMIVPENYCSDPFHHQKDLNDLHKHFYVLGAVPISPKSFQRAGVEYYRTMVLILQKKTEKEIEAYEIVKEPLPIRYFVSMEEFRDRVFQEALNRKKGMGQKIYQELHNQKERGSFEYKLAKYLYQIKIHPATSNLHSTALAKYEQLLTQEKPENIDWKEWENRKLTPNKVLAFMRNIIKKQNPPKRKPEDIIRFVKTQYGYKYKAYSPKMKSQLPQKNEFKSWEVLPVGELINYNDRDIRPLIPDNRYRLEMMDLADIPHDANIGSFLDSFRFVNDTGPGNALSAIQKNDLNPILQRRYSILNWQQGAGKTPATMAWAQYNLQHNHTRVVFVVSAALAINLTWIPFLKQNGVPFVHIQKYSDIKKIRPNSGQFALISTNMVSTYKKYLYVFMKQQKQRVALIFDESDEITSPGSKRTKAILSVFRRVNRKLLATGTTTRNNINELYSQMELLYNNSALFLCDTDRVYIVDKKTGRIDEKKNKRQGIPYPARGGHQLFSACFNPEKITVLGIGKKEQNIYNERFLRKLISRTIITKKFREIVGEDKYSIETVLVDWNPEEEKLYSIIMDELYTMIQTYCKSTGNNRKDAALKTIQQIQMFIRASSIPHTFKEHYTSGEPNSKSVRIMKMLRGKLSGTQVCIGCTTKEAVSYYTKMIKEQFPERPVYSIIGEVTFKNRGGLLKEFAETTDGIVVCTQQALKSSLNIPSCRNVIVESMQWNIPKIEQFFFRFIRYTSTKPVSVFFLHYRQSIENNIKALLMSKERLNDYIKTLEFRDESDIFEEYGVDGSILDLLIQKDYDENGKSYLRWGRSRVS